MAVLKPRSRLIYVRISEDEFQKITTLCQTEGARSMSDLMRAALQRLVDEPHPVDQRQAERLETLSEMIHEVNAKLGQLTGMLAHYFEGNPNGRTASGPGGPGE